MSTLLTGPLTPVVRHSRYISRREDGGGDSLSFPQVALPSGYEWMGSWKVEVAASTDEEGWCYGSIWPQVDLKLPNPKPLLTLLTLLWPQVNFPFEAAVATPFEVRRRRWTRARKEASGSRERMFDIKRQIPTCVSCAQTSEGREARTRADLISALDPRSRDRLTLGKLGPGGRLPLPLSWSHQEAGFELQFRPCVTGEGGEGGIEEEEELDALLKREGYEWSHDTSSSSGGEGRLVLTALEEGGTRLFTCTPRASQPSLPPPQPSQPSASPLGLGSLVDRPGSLTSPHIPDTYCPQVTL